MCNTTLNEPWPIPLSYIENDNYGNEQSECMDKIIPTKYFLRIFFRHHVSEITALGDSSNDGSRKAITKSFMKSLEDGNGNNPRLDKIRETVAGGAWDENFPGACRIIWKLNRNTCPIPRDALNRLRSNNLITNNIYKNFRKKEHEINGVTTVNDLITEMEAYTKSEYLSPVFTNWAVWSNSIGNMLREADKGYLKNVRKT